MPWPARQRSLPPAAGGLFAGVTGAGRLVFNRLPHAMQLPAVAFKKDVVRIGGGAWQAECERYTWK
jgi:hypothetical protein